MTKDKQRVRPGNVLLAQPFMEDVNLKRSVVFLVQHSDEDGSVGFILNKPYKTNISELIDEFPDFEAEVFFGGPVSIDTLHYIHNVGELLEDSIEVMRGVYWGGNFEKLKFLIKSELIETQNIRFFIGYSGWSEGQLTEELKHGSWVVSDMDPNYAFKSNHGNLWSQVLDNKGDIFSVIARMPEGISLN